MLIPIALTYIAKWSWFFVLFFLFVLKTENQLFLRNQRGNWPKSLSRYTGEDGRLWVLILLGAVAHKPWPPVIGV